MAQNPAVPGSAQGETRMHAIEGVVIYARRDKQGKPALLDAIDTDERKIRAIADHLWRRGFGVMRQRNPRAGKVFYLFKAMWAEPGDPPDDPFDDRE
jgi:hypothetical protein